MDAAAILLVLMSPALLAIFTGFILKLRRSGGIGHREAEELRAELRALQRDYQQMKSDHSHVLIDLESSTRRLESRLDHLAGIDVPAPQSSSARPQSERQL